MFPSDPHGRRDLSQNPSSVVTTVPTQPQQGNMMTIPIAVGPGKSFECTEPGCNKRAQRSTTGLQIFCCQHMREKGLKPMESRRQCAHSDASGKPCLKQVQRSHDGKYTHCREHMKLYGLKPANRAVCRFPGCKKRVNREKKLCDLHTNPQIQRAMLEGTLGVNDEDGGSGNTDSDTDPDKARNDLMGLSGTPAGMPGGLPRGMMMGGMDPSPMSNRTQPGFNTPGKMPANAGNNMVANPHAQRAQVLEAKVTLLEGQLKQQSMQIEQLSKFIQQQQMLIERQNAMLSGQAKQVEQQAKMIEQQQEMLGHPKMQQVTQHTDPNGTAVVHDMSQGGMSVPMSMTMQLHHPMYQERHDPSAMAVSVGHEAHQQQQHQQQQQQQQLVPEQAM